MLVFLSFLKVMHFSFLLQMHIMGYNSEVYKTLEEAMNGVRGLVTITVFIEVTKGLITSQ